MMQLCDNCGHSHAPHEIARHHFCKWCWQQFVADMAELEHRIEHPEAR